jgi:hypothetical protein
MTFAPKTYTVDRITPRQDGAYFVIASNGRDTTHGVSLIELKEGQRVRVTAGKVVAA